jgi:hypothetical protein
MSIFLGAPQFLAMTELQANVALHASFPLDFDLLALQTNKFPS